MSRAKSVRRVVYTSSVIAACPLNEEGELINGSTLDESTWTPVDFMRRKAHPISVRIYSVSSIIEFVSEVCHNLKDRDYDTCSFMRCRKLWRRKQRLSMA
jgi:hypothetical protein